MNSGEPVSQASKEAPPALVTSSSSRPPPQPPKPKPRMTKKVFEANFKNDNFRFLKVLGKGSFGKVSLSAFWALSLQKNVCSTSGTCKMNCQ